MRYADLYNYANGSQADFVPVKLLAAKIVADHPPIEQVDFWPVELDPNISLGHMVYERAKSSAYGESFTIANIRFEKRQNRCWARFIGCKELMHVFDNEPQSVNSRQKFLQLMAELQTQPMEKDMSAMFSSEVNAEWMALLVLCPERLRAKWRQQCLDKTVSEYNVALALRIPEIFIKAVIGDYYDIALKTLTT